MQSLADRYLRGLSAERYLQQVGLAEYAANGLVRWSRFRGHQTLLTFSPFFGVKQVHFGSFREAHNYERKHCLKKGRAPRFKIKIPQASNEQNIIEQKALRYAIRTSQTNIEQKPEERKVFIAGFPYSTSQQEIRELFEQCGTVESIDLPKNEYGYRKSFGFVTYEKPEAAKRAIKELNGALLNKGTVIVKEYERKNYP